ncbi:MAG: transposase [PVC group bacterium]|nr:transposase [PVC group bacterium]
MRRRRSFSKEFKRGLIEELLSGASKVSELCRKHDLSNPLISNWKQDYLDGKLDNEPVTDAGYKHKVEELERMVGQLTMDNALLKKALKSANNQPKSNGKFSEIISPLTRRSKGGAK